MDDILEPSEFIDPSTVGQVPQNANHSQAGAEDEEDVEIESGQDYEVPIHVEDEEGEEEKVETILQRDVIPSDEEVQEESLKPASMLMPNEVTPINNEAALSMKFEKEKRFRELQENKLVTPTEVTGLGQPTQVMPVPDELKPEQLWDAAVQKVAEIKEKPLDSAWAAIVDSGKFWAFEKDDFAAQAFKNITEKIGNNAIRLYNSIQQEVPEELLEYLQENHGDAGAFGELPLMDLNVATGHEYQPNTTTGRLLLYPTELAVTTFSILGALKKFKQAITLTKVAAAEVGAAVMLTTPDDMTLSDYLWQSDDPNIRRYSFEFLRTNGDSQAVKMFKQGVEEVMFNALVAFAGKGAIKAGSAAVDWTRKGVDKTSEWAKTIHHYRKLAKKKADLLGDTMSVIKDVEDTKAVIVNSAAKDSPDGGGRLVELAHTPVKPGSRTIPQFKLQQQDGFTMESNPIATMARQLPPDTKGRSSDLIKDFAEGFTSNYNRKDFYSTEGFIDKESSKAQIQSVLPGKLVGMKQNLDQIDEFLSTPGTKLVKKDPIIYSGKKEVHKVEPELTGSAEGEPAHAAFQSLEQNLHEFEYTFDTSKVDDFHLSVAEPEKLLHHHQFSKKGRIQLRESYDKMVATIEKKYHANLTPEDLPLLRDNPAALKQYQNLDATITASERQFQANTQVKVQELVLGLYKFSNVEGRPTGSELTELKKLIAAVEDTRAFKPGAIENTIDSFMKQTDDVVSIKRVSYREQMRDFADHLGYVLVQMDDLTTARRTASAVSLNRPIGDQSAAEFVKSQYDSLGPTMVDKTTMPITRYLDELAERDRFGILHDSLVSGNTREALLNIEEVAKRDMFRLRMRERAMRGKEHLRYDRHFHMAEETLEKVQADHVKEKLKLQKEIDQRRNLLGRAKSAMAKQKEQFAEYKRKVKIKEELKDLKLETQMKNRERQFNEDIAGYEKDIDIRDKKIQALEKNSTFLIDKQIPLVNPESKFVRLDSKNKVVANLSYLNTEEDFHKAIEEIKGYLYTNVQKEPRIISDVFLAAWKRGELLPSDVRKKVAAKLGLLQDEMQDMSPYAEKHMRELEKNWNAVDLAAMMKIVDASWERLNTLAKLSSENTYLTSGEIEALGISKQTYNKLRKGPNIEATLLFGEEFETFFYKIYPQVWEGLQTTPTIISQARNIEDRLAFMGRIEDVITKVGDRGDKLKNIARMAEEFRAINEEGGYKGLQLFKKQIEAANLSYKPFWHKWVDSVLFVRATSMLSSVKTLKNIFSSGVIETGKKVFMEYPIESSLRALNSNVKQTATESAREILAMHSWGWQNAMKAALRVTAKHADDLSGIINPMRHYRRDYRFTRPYVDPATSSVDMARQVRTNPLRYKPEEHGIFGALSDMFAAQQELPYFGIDVLDDAFKAINIQFRLPIVAMRQANADARTYMADAMARAEKVYELKKSPKEGSNVIALKAYHKYLDDYDPVAYRKERYNYYLENPTEDMMTDYRQHYREVTLLEDLKENGRLNDLYEALTKPRGFRQLWPFMLTQLNSFKNRIEQGVWRLPLEARMAYYLLNEKKKIRAINVEMDRYQPGTPAYKRYQELIEKSGPILKQQMYDNSILSHSVWDSSDPNKQIHQQARWATGLLITAAAGYFAKDYITGTSSKDISNYDVARKAMGVQDEALFIHRDRLSFGDDATYDKGIYIPYRSEEPFGHFLRTAADFSKLSMFLSREQYEEASLLFSWTAFKVYTPEIIREIGKDLSFVMDFMDKDIDTGTTKALNLIQRKSEMMFSAADPLKIPPETVNKSGAYLKGLIDSLPESEHYDKEMLKRDIDWATDPERGDYWFPIGLKGIINDLRRWQKDKKQLEEEGEFLMRNVSIEKAGQFEGVQERFTLFRRITDAILKSYRNKTPGLSQDLDPVLNLFGQPMRVAPNYGIFSIAGYMMPNTAFGDRMRRADMENAPSPKLLSDWETADMRNDWQPSQDADDMIDASMEAFSKEERKYNRFWAEVIRLGYQENWEGNLRNEKAWAARPILKTVSKTFEGAGSSFALSHSQRNEIIWYTNNSKHEDNPSMVAKYGDKTMIEALDAMITNNYYNELGPKQFERQARKDAIDQVIEDYSLLGREKFLENNEEVSSAIEDKALGE